VGTRKWGWICLGDDNVSPFKKDLEVAGPHGLELVPLPRSMTCGPKKTKGGHTGMPCPWPPQSQHNFGLKMRACWIESITQSIYGWQLCLANRPHGRFQMKHCCKFERKFTDSKVEER
jgi:hypothetical protein